MLRKARRGEAYAHRINLKDVGTVPAFISLHDLRGHVFKCRHANRQSDIVAQEKLSQ